MIDNDPKPEGALEVGDVFYCQQFAKGDAMDDRDPDPENGRAAFVVIRAGYSGGGYAHGPGDMYPNGWMVTAVRQDKPSVVITFLQSGAFNDIIAPDDVVILNRKATQ